NPVQRILLLVIRCRLEHLLHGGGEALRDLPSQVFLAFEVMEKAALREPRRLADLIDRSGRVALGHHQLLRSFEQLLPGQRIGLGCSHGAYLPVGMRITPRRFSCQGYFSTIRSSVRRPRVPSFALSRWFTEPLCHLRRSLTHSSRRSAARPISHGLH